MQIYIDENRLKKGYRYEIRGSKEGVMVIEIPQGKIKEVIPQDKAQHND